MGSKMRGLLDAVSTAPWYLVNPIFVVANKGSNSRTDLRFK